MKRTYLTILSFLLGIMILSGCQQKSKSDSPVLAKVGNSEITQDDYLKEVSRLPEWARAQFSGREGKIKFLDELIRRELVYQDAKRMKLDKDPEFRDKMREFERATLVSLIVKKEVEEKAKIEDAEVKSFYEKNKDKLTLDNKVRASHILVDSEDQAKKLHERIKKGESLAKLAETYSKDKASAKNGGDLGYFDPAKMVPEFSRALMALKPGEVSEPVKSRFGFHLIQLVDVQRGEVATFEQSQEAIRRQVLSEKQRALFDSYIENLKEKSKVTQNDSALDSITLPWEKGETK